jgi:hypothetical protein
MEQQIVIIVIIGLISLVNWLMKSSAELRERRRQERERLGIPEGDPYHEDSRKAKTPGSLAPPTQASSPEMRRLLEALGLPADEEQEPPAPVVLPPIPACQPPTPRKPSSGKPRGEMPHARASAIPPAAPVSPLSLALHSRDSIRQAIVLRELLGPPKAFTI